MSFLFDQNLSRKLPGRIADRFPNSTQAFLLGLSRSDDQTIWQVAIDRGLAIVTYDNDYVEMSDRLGAPPKVIHLPCANLPNSVVEALIRTNADVLDAFLASAAERLIHLR